jgi:hypothetical protein
LTVSAVHTSKLWQALRAEEPFPRLLKTVAKLPFYNASSPPDPGGVDG